MSWFGMTDEERREWRDHPTTKAYFSELTIQIAMGKDEVVSAMLDETDEMTNRARRMAGRIDGFETAIKIMERDA